MCSVDRYHQEVKHGSSWCGLCQGCPLSLILFGGFLDRITRRIQGEESLQVEGLTLTSLLFADNVDLVASSDHKLSVKQLG